MIKPIYQRIAILGDGVTASSVRRHLSYFGCCEVSLDFADVIVTSPGIPPDKLPYASVPIISDIEFAWLLLKQYHPDVKVIGVTGTNGKTTVTQMLSHILDCSFAGNIGIPLIEYVVQAKSKEMVVVELSSYQLEYCDRFCPDISILLNITEDHLDRHKTMVHYSRQKAGSFINQNKEQCLVYDDSDPLVKALVRSANCRLKPYSDYERYRTGLLGLSLVGQHNIRNALGSMIVAEHIGFSFDYILDKLSSFSVPEHRLESVCVRGDHFFVNDSKSTNFRSTQVAIDAFLDRDIQLILCGQEKAVDSVSFKAFVLSIVSRVSGITCFGAVSERLERVFKEIGYTSFCRVETLSEALQSSYQCLSEGGLVLFSPGFASFDQFDNYEHRGREFKRQVQLCFS